MNDKIQYFTKNKNGWEPIKFEDGSSIPPKGLLQYKPSTFEIETQIEARRNKKAFKDLRAIILGYARPSGIKRTRKRQIAKAKHMMAWHDHTSYEWSQWWKESARKPKRWKK